MEDYSRALQNYTHKKMKKLTLLVSYYAATESARQREIDDVLVANVTQSAFDQVHIFAEIQPPPEASSEPHVHVVQRTSRPTFNDWFVYAKRIQDENPENTHVFVLCNSDIYVPAESVKMIGERCTPHRALALSRYNVSAAAESPLAALHAATLEKRARLSQDTWCFYASKELCKIGKYKMGVWGCDNRLAHELHGAVGSVENYALQIRTYHVHRVPHKYVRGDEIISKPHKLLEPHLF